MNRILEQIKINDHTCNWYCSWILATMVFLGPVEDVLSYLGEHLIGGVDEYVSLATASVVTFVLIIPAIFRMRVTADSVLVFFFIFLSWFISLSSHMEYSQFYYKEAWHIMAVGCSIYCIARNITDYSECYDIMQKAAIIGIVFVFMQALIGIVNGDMFETGYDYNATGSARIVPPATFMLMMFYDRKRPIYLITFMAGIALMVFYGGRSSLLCVSLAFVLMLFDRVFMNNNTRQGSTRSRYGQWGAGFVTVIGSAVLLMVCHGDVSDELKGVPGLRIVNMLNSGSFFEGSGRWEIWESAVEYIKAHPYIGSGLLYDRVILAGSPLVIEHYGNRIDTVTRWTGVYAHNLFLELLMQYGMLMGLALSVIIALAVLLLLFDDCTEKRRIAIFLVSYTLGYHFLSGTIFRSRSFWTMLAMAAGTVLRRHPIIKDLNFKRGD